MSRHLERSDFLSEDQIAPSRREHRALAPCFVSEDETIAADGSCFVSERLAPERNSIESDKDSASIFLTEGELGTAGEPPATEQGPVIVGETKLEAQSFASLRAYLWPLAMAALAVLVVESVTRWSVPSVAAPTESATVAVNEPDKAAIDRVLGTYQQSYSALDAAMVSTIWRGLDTRGLQRAFDGLDSQRMSFERCDVTVDDDKARATCTGVLDYVRKVGQTNPLHKRLLWNFDLQRTDDDRWLISKVDAR